MLFYIYIYISLYFYISITNTVYYYLLFTYIRLFIIYLVETSYYQSRSVISCYSRLKLYERRKKDLVHPLSMCDQFLLVNKYAVRRINSTQSCRSFEEKDSHFRRTIYTVKLWPLS